MATSNADDVVSHTEKALAALSEAESEISQIDSDYSPVFADMASALSVYIEADRDGQIDDTATMLVQLKQQWEAQQNTEETQ